MTELTPEHFERCIAAAKAAEFHHYAESLQILYAREFPKEAARHAASFGPEQSRVRGSVERAPLFRKLVGTDFGVANAAARARGNPVNDQIREHRQRVLPTNPHP